MSNTYFKAMSVMGCEIGGITRRSLCRHNCCDGENCVTWLEKQFAKLNEYEEAKADGRLVVLPCKVGTRVWVIGQDCDLCHDMYTEEPCLFGDCEYRKVIESVFLPGMTDEFGKTVFLTREEAEKAIGGKEDE